MTQETEGKRRMREKVEREEALTDEERKQRLLERFQHSVETMEALKARGMDGVTPLLTVKDLKVLIEALQ